MNWNAALSNGGSYALSGAMTGNPYAAVGLGAYGFVTGLLQDDGTVDLEKLLGPDLDTLRTRSASNTTLAGDLIGKGDQALAPTLNYYRNLLSGNPAEVMAATAPDRGRVIDQYDTARKAMATFGPRGGGQTSAAAMSRVSQANDLSEILSTARDKGAEGATRVGTQYLSAGLQTNALAGQDLNAVINALLAQSGQQINQQQFSQAQAQSQGEALGQLVGLLLTRQRAGGGGGVGTAGIGGAITPNPRAGL